MPAPQIEPGQIYRHQRFYLNADGKFKAKYFLIFTESPGNDLIFALLTSRDTGRPTEPRCFHGNPYPGFCLGIPGNPLSRETWLDLRSLHELERSSFNKQAENRFIDYVTSLEPGLLIEGLDCAAGADDTTRYQARLILDTRAELANAL